MLILKIIEPYDFKSSFFGQFIINFFKKRIKFYIEGSFDFVDVRDVVKTLIAAKEGEKIRENYIISGKYYKFDY